MVLIVMLQTILSMLYTKKIHYHAVLNILSMAKIEYLMLTDMDDEVGAVIQEHGENFVWLYGQCDPYTPLHFPKELHQLFPKTHVFMCSDKDVEHAFCLASSGVVAEQIHHILMDKFGNEF